MKATDALARLEKAASKLPHTTRAMFGGHALLTPHGKMFGGVWKDGAAVKLAPERADHEALVALGGVPWAHVSSTGVRKPMRGWLIVPPDVMRGRGLATWVQKAHALAQARGA